MFFLGNREKGKGESQGRGLSENGMHWNVGGRIVNNCSLIKMWGQSQNFQLFLINYVNKEQLKF